MIILCTKEKGNWEMWQGRRGIRREGELLLPSTIWIGIRAGTQYNLWCNVQANGWEGRGTALKIYCLDQLSGWNTEPESMV